MEKVITTSEYGYSIFSVDSMSEFLSKEKIKSKKVLAFLQKDKKKYLKSLENGSWLPIPAVDFGKVLVSVEGYDDPFSDEWEEALTYEGFNISVKNGLWVTDIALFLKFDENEYRGEGTELPGDFGTKEFFSNKEKWYTTYDGETVYNGFCYDVPDGKYLITLTIYARKEIVDMKSVNYGLRIGLNKVEQFTDCKNPRDEEHNFTVHWLRTSNKATVHWLPKKESGIKWPLEKEQLNHYLAIPLADGTYTYLVAIFDLKMQTEENVSSCRVRIDYKKPKDFSLKSGMEYPIFEEIYKRGKYSYKELGTITIE